MKKLLLLVPALVACSCSGFQNNPKTADAAVQLVDAGCVVLEAATDSAAVDKVCATATELAPFVKLILARRASRAADAGAD